MEQFTHHTGVWRFLFGLAILLIVFRLAQLTLSQSIVDCIARVAIIRSIYEQSGERSSCELERHWSGPRSRFAVDVHSTQWTRLCVKLSLLNSFGRHTSRFEQRAVSISFERLHLQSRRSTFILSAALR